MKVFQDKSFWLINWIEISTEQNQKWPHKGHKTIRDKIFLKQGTISVATIS